MLVGEVYAAREAAVRSPPMLSAGRPVRGTTIARTERHVSAAYLSRVVGRGRGR